MNRSTHHRRLRRATALVAVPTLAVLALVAGCSKDDGGSVRESGSSSGSSSGSGAASGSGSAAADCTDEATGDATVEAKVGEWFITPDPTSVPAGSVVIRGENTGTMAHEILVVKAASRSDLPLKEDGSLDESKLPEGAVIGEVEGIPAGKTCSAAFDLEPGSYLLLCNIVEEMDGMTEVHLKQGMIAPLTVT